MTARRLLVAARNSEAVAPLRYMGTKRMLAPTVRAAIESLGPRAAVADLFSGIGSVASRLAPDFPVLVNDSLAFTSVFARARFLESVRIPLLDAARQLVGPFQARRAALRRQFRTRLEDETLALQAGTASLRAYMASAPHVGNSEEFARRATRARTASGSRRYRMTTLYFSAGYFSTEQAIDLDALRYAIDTAELPCSREWLLAAWLSAAGALINSPGHSAQFLMPRNSRGAERIRRRWRRRVWETFLDRLEILTPVGSREWRAQNEVATNDALDFVRSTRADSISVFYADPPYTRDQYSRFYHVYESLFLYDFPESTGQGRYRAHRFHTAFSTRSGVHTAFASLVGTLAARGKPLVVSYPQDGLLERAGGDLEALLGEFYSVRCAAEVPLQHSTLGAARGIRTKATLERIYVCKP